MLIRPMKPAETMAVTDIWESSVRKTHHWYEPNTENVIAVFRKSILKFVTPENTVVLEDNGILVGMAAEHNNKVDMLFIDGNHLHNGYGTLLLHYMMREKGLYHLDVYEQNNIARQFYAQMGFTQILNRRETDEKGFPFPVLNLEYKK